MDVHFGMEDMTMRRFVMASLAASTVATGTAQALPSAVKGAVKANSQFACDLYRKLSATKGNLFLSPFSISMALGMTYAGARNQTAAEMGKVLHYSNPTVQSGMGYLMADLTKKNRGYELIVANGIWPARRFALDKTYVDLVQETYHSAIKALNFGESGSRETINSWVAQKTGGKIKDLIPAGLLNGDTRLVLTNAIYFKGTWKTTFDPKSTHEAPFTTAAGKQVNCQLMEVSSQFRSGQMGTTDILEMPTTAPDCAWTSCCPTPMAWLNSNQAWTIPNWRRPWGLCRRARL